MPEPRQLFSCVVLVVIAVASLKDIRQNPETLFLSFFHFPSYNNLKWRQNEGTSGKHFFNVLSMNKDYTINQCSPYNRQQNVHPGLHGLFKMSASTHVRHSTLKKWCCPRSTNLHIWFISIFEEKEAYISQKRKLFNLLQRQEILGIQYIVPSPQTSSTA